MSKKDKWDHMVTMCCAESFNPVPSLFSSSLFNSLRNLMGKKLAGMELIEKILLNEGFIVGIGTVKGNAPNSFMEATCYFDLKSVVGNQPFNNIICYCHSASGRV